MKTRNIKTKKVLDKYYKEIDEEKEFDRDMNEYYEENEELEENTCPKNCYGHQIEACNVCNI